MNLHQIKKCIYGVSLILGAALCMTGCGKDDELVLITTEKSTDNLSEQTDTDAGEKTEEVTEEVTEEASAEERTITIDDIASANSGDILLSGGEGVSVTTVYYSSGTEIANELRYLGFDDNGSYIQVYEDADGGMEVLDNLGQCLYISADNSIYVRLYPEDSVLARLIDYNHNHTVVEAADGESVVNVYRSGDSLVAETSVTETSGDTLTYKYYMNDDLLVDVVYGYNSDGELLSCEQVTRGASYDVPDEIADALLGGLETRTIEVVYADGDGVGNIYYVPKAYRVELELYSCGAYSDEDCTVEWSDIKQDSSEYSDSVIYLRGAE